MILELCKARITYILVNSLLEDGTELKVRIDFYTRSVSDNKRCAVTPQDRDRIRADLKRIATLFDDNTCGLWPIM